MALSRFKPATRARSKLRMAIDGPSGSGKSYTGLRFAFSLAAAEAAKRNGGDTGSLRVAAIDTEHGSLSKYQGASPDGVPFEFDVLELASFSPSEYAAAIEDAAAAKYDVLLIDSLSHAWEGKDGALEIKDRKGGNSYTAWKDVTPLHRRMIEAILAAPLHVIATMRSKTEHVLEKDDKGREVPRRVGMRPVQREGMEYEFDLYASLDWSHQITVSKSRCSAMDAATAFKPAASFLNPVIEWLDTGTVSRLPELRRSIVDDATVTRIVAKIATLGRDPEKEKKDIFKRYSAAEFTHLTPGQAGDYERRLDAAIVQAAKRTTPAAAAATTTNGTPAQQESPPTEPKQEAASSLPPDTAKAASSASAPPAVNGHSHSTAAGSITVQQLGEMRARRDELWMLNDVVNPAEIAAAWQPILVKRGVSVEKELSEAVAAELIDSLRTKIRKWYVANGKPEACPF